MSLRPDHKALVFVGSIALLGAAVRIMRAATGGIPVAAQPALDHQLAAADSARTQQARGRGGQKRRAGGRRGQEPSAAPDQRSVSKGKLDLDIATAAQLDSLPGVTPMMARRIVADRMVRGPFMSKDGLQRVTGVGPGLLQKLDTLITFSGTFLPSSPADTMIAPRKRRPRSPTTGYDAPGGRYKFIYANPPHTRDRRGRSAGS
ncbi:MAG: ComEA family DNA-binding protein [Gemmatimonas sp.]|nr:helix-hairpin-helix domain-containing protein [Gemmatimonadaceae bacterium]